MRSVAERRMQDSTVRALRPSAGTGVSSSGGITLGADRKALTSPWAATGCSTSSARARAALRSTVMLSIAPEPACRRRSSRRTGSRAATISRSRSSAAFRARCTSRATESRLRRGPGRRWPSCRDRRRRSRGEPRRPRRRRVGLGITCRCGSHRRGRPQLPRVAIDLPRSGRSTHPCGGRPVRSRGDGGSGLHRIGTPRHTLDPSGPFDALGLIALRRAHLSVARLATCVRTGGTGRTRTRHPSSVCQSTWTIIQRPSYFAICR
jgi:hypothetical protein